MDQDKVEYRTVDSRSRADVKHTVIIVNDVPYGCTCEAFKYAIQRPGVDVYVCIHMDEMYKRIAAEIKARLATYKGTKPEWLYGTQA